MDVATSSMTSPSKGTNNELIIKIKGVSNAGEADTIWIIWSNIYSVVEADVDSITKLIIGVIVPYYECDDEVIDEKY